MENVSILMRTGWALWSLVAGGSLFLLWTGKPRPEYVREASLLYRQAIMQTVLSVAYIILLTPDIAPKVVTADTRWLFMLAPWLCLVVSIVRFPRIAKYTLPRG
jgi:hypothetical protein